MTTVRELRLARGLTQQQLAQKAEIGMWLAGKLDTGHRPRSAPVRNAVAAALGTKAAEIWPDEHHANR